LKPNSSKIRQSGLTLRAERVIKCREIAYAEKLATAGKLASHHFFAAMDSFGKSPQKGMLISLTRPLPGEIPTQCLAEELFKLEVLLCYPKIQTQMEMYQVDGVDASHFQMGKFGIEEPSGNAVVRPDSIKIAVVPGVWFGHGGERIGMGKGYFDRYLDQTLNAFKVGFCFEDQLQEALPQEAWDVRMDVIVTENRWIECG